MRVEQWTHPEDALLAQFPSAIEAVNCAVDIQCELGNRNTSLPEHRATRFRIGINLGDVTEQDGALYGDGVNIAASLESLAGASGICVSGAVYDQVEGNLSVVFKFAGEQQVKHIAKPVRAYHVVLDFAESHHAKMAPSRSKRTMTLVGLTLLIVAGIAVWLAIRFDFIPGKQRSHPKRTRYSQCRRGPRLPCFRLPISSHW